MIINYLITDRYKASIIVSAFLLLFYSSPWVILKSFTLNSNINQNLMMRYLCFAIWVLIVVCVVGILFKSKSDFIRLSKFFTLIALVMTSYNLGVIGYWSTQRSEIKKLELPNSTKRGIRPDIYYIILDAYARNDVLINYYNYDNNDFLYYLLGNGFYVANKSHSNYAFTELSISSSLNFSYVDSLIENSVIIKNDRMPIIYNLKKSRIQKFLKHNGYKTISFSTGFCATEIKDADKYFSSGIELNDFENSVINTTPLPLINNEFQYNLHRKRIEFTFNRIANISTQNQPKFVFAHIFSPHPPFVFGKGGEKLMHKKNFNRVDGKYVYENEKYVELYRNQLSYINKKLRDTIGKILFKKERPVVIILQGDHGPRSMVNLSNKNDSSMKEAMSILFACYTNNNKDLFYSTITPVNLFRLILNQYFGTKLRLLEDISYFSTANNYYNFVNVNDEL
jgi:hypothetical protein